MQSKHFIFVGAVALCSALSAADSITTRHGITYSNAVIQRADPDGVVIEYAPQPGSVGMAKLKFANLPDDLRQRYNYNAADAAAFEQNQAAGVARREAAIAQGEIEKQRRYDKLAELRAEREAVLEAKRQEAAAMAAAQMERESGYGGGYYYGGEDWYGTGRRRHRVDSPGPVTRAESTGFSSGVGLSGLGTGWGDAGHWGPHASEEPTKSNHSGTFRSPPDRGHSSNSPARSR